MRRESGPEPVGRESGSPPVAMRSAVESMVTRLLAGGQTEHGER
jgi:hypothetical protein